MKLIRKVKNWIKGSVVYRFWKFRNAPVILTDNYGIRFVLYSWDKMLIDKHISRWNYIAEYEAMKRIIKSGDTVLDVGANVGLHSVLFDRWVGDSGKVFSFEPVPHTLGLLRETLALNNVKNVEVIEQALSDRVVVQTMQVFDRAHNVWNSLGKPVYGNIKPKETVEIKTNTLDNFCKGKGIEKIDFMKIDVEGYEKFVLQGAENLLKNKKIKCFSFEISEVPLSGSGVKAEEVFQIIKKHNYFVYSYDVKKKVFEGPIDKSNTFYDNYFSFAERI